MKTTSIITTVAALALLAVNTNEMAAQFSGRWKTDFSNHTVPFDEISSGGPAKDGIPAIDHPRFETVRQADRWLDDREPVVLVNIGNVAKAYPLQILIWHEIVNDEVGDTPVSVTFCPLCNTALSFDRRFDGQVLDFGTTGRLRHSDLIMYDRQTETWWQQATGEGIIGKYAGRRLEFIGSPLISWGTFKEQFGDGQVLSRDTGHRRSYGQNPYAGYDNPRGGPFRRFFGAKVDKRLSAMERVVALELGEEVRAYPFSSLKKKRVVADKVAGRDIVVFWSPGTSSALDNRSIAKGRDVGSSGVFDRHLGDRILTFEPGADGQFHDKETKSTWNILGRAVAGPLTGQALTPIQHGNHFWFAWGVFKPNTKVVQ